MSALDILGWMAFGLVAGGVAKLIMPGKDPGGCLVTIGLGIAGALLGGWLAETLLGLGDLEVTGFRSLLLAIAGALLLLLLYRVVFGWRVRRDFQPGEPLERRREPRARMADEGAPHEREPAEPPDRSTPLEPSS